MDTNKSGKISNESSMTKSNETSRSLIVSLNFESADANGKVTLDLKRPDNQIANAFNMGGAASAVPINVHF